MEPINVKSPTLQTIPSKFFLLLFLALLCFSGAVSVVSAQTTTADVCRETQKVIEQYDKERIEANRILYFKLNELTMTRYEQQIANRNLLNKSDLDRLIEDFFDLKLPKEFSRMTVEERFAFQRQFLPLLRQELAAIYGITLEEIKERRERISQQLEPRRERYKSLDCETVLAREKEKACKLEGTWEQYETAGGVPETTWTITGSGNNNASEEGGGNATGTATLDGRKLKIVWTTKAGWAGYYEWELKEDCNFGEGKLEFTAVGEGTRTSKVKRK